MSAALQRSINQVPHSPCAIGAGLLRGLLGRPTAASARLVLALSERPLCPLRARLHAPTPSDDACASHGRCGVEGRALGEVDCGLAPG